MLQRTNYAVRLRYPTELGLTEEDAEKAIGDADTVMGFVRAYFDDVVAEPDEELGTQESQE